MIAKPKTQERINWTNLLFIGLYHVFLLAALPFYFYYMPPSWGLVTATVVTLYAAGLGITAGYHRCFSHQTYRTNPVVECILLFLGTLATQGSAIRWSYEHRLHHSFVDTDDDPYSINKGFWYAHILWLFTKDRQVDRSVVADLYRKPYMVFQHEHFPACVFVSNILVVLLFGWLFNDYVGAFIMVWWVRLFFLHHFTWMINSAAHYWGTQSYSQEHTAVDNYLISLFTFGEGYHNYHHTFANDYRNGIRWYHFDPTKWLIWTLSKLGLASGLRRVESHRINKKLIAKDQQQLIEKIKSSITTGKDKLEGVVNEMAEGLQERATELHKLMQRLKQEKASSSRQTLKSLKREIKAMKRSFNQEWKEWRALARQIQRLAV